MNVSGRTADWNPSPVIYPGLSLGGIAGGPLLAFPVVIYYTYRRVLHGTVVRS